RINYVAVFHAEVESVWIVGIIRRGFPGDAFACVLDDACAFGNELRGVNAPAVHAGLPNLDLDGSLPSSCFLCHTRARNHLFSSCCQREFYSSMAPLISRRCWRNV